MNTIKAKGTKNEVENLELATPEKWKPIDEFNGRYEVSNKGRVRALYTNGGNKREEPLVMKLNEIHGYKYITLWNGEKYFCRRVHRLEAKAFIPNPKNKPCVNHLDGDKSNNNLPNLEWCTHSENDIHAFENGLRGSVKGEDNGHSKLTEEQVIEIRSLCSESELSQRDIGEKYGVSQSVISEIHNRNYWKHI